MVVESLLNRNLINWFPLDALDIPRTCRCLNVFGIEVNEIDELPPEPTVTVAIDS